jgi:hypothetical protein
MNMNTTTSNPVLTTARIMKSRLLALLLMAAVTAIGLPGRAQDATKAEPDDLRAILEMMRSDVNSYKIRTLNQVMALTGPEAEAFWPTYRQYEKQLAAVGDRKVALLREFAALRSAGTMDKKTWDSLARRWLKNVQDRLNLWKKYQKRIAKAVSPMRAAQFLQVEHQMALFVDLNIASEMPVLGTLAPEK